MKFYRVWYQNYEGVQKGYSWFTSRADARRDIAMWKRQQRKVAQSDIAMDSSIGDSVTLNRRLDQYDSFKTAPGGMENFEITPTKQGILKALNSYARNDVTEQ